MENKIRHLELIQNVIERMANNSFLIKGWCITLVSALLALATQDNSKKLIIVVLFPAFMFWLLDSYFLWQERLFRQKYQEITQVAPESIDFSLNVSSVEGQTDSWLRIIFSKTLLLFYGSMISFVAIIILVLWD